MMFTPDKIIDALAPMLTDERRQRIAHVAAYRLKSLTVVLENLHDPHNGAAVLRSAEALGLLDVYVVERKEPFSFSSKVAQGCEKWISMHRFPDFGAAAQTLHTRGFQLCGAVPYGGETVDDLDISKPTALVFGNEHAGLSKEAQRACELTFCIPMWGFTQSFNLSVSVAISLYACVQKRRLALKRTGELNEDEITALCSRYYALSVDKQVRDSLMQRADKDGTIRRG